MYGRRCCLAGLSVADTQPPRRRGAHRVALRVLLQLLLLWDVPQQRDRHLCVPLKGSPASPHRCETSSQLPSMSACKAAHGPTCAQGTRRPATWTLWRLRPSCACCALAQWSALSACWRRPLWTAGWRHVGAAQRPERPARLCPPLRCLLSSRRAGWTPRPPTAAARSCRPPCRAGRGTARPQDRPGQAAARLALPACPRLPSLQAQGALARPGGRQQPERGGWQGSGRTCVL